MFPQLEESEFTCAAAVKARKSMEVEIEDLHLQIDDLAKAKAAVRAFGMRCTQGDTPTSAALAGRVTPRRWGWVWGGWVPRFRGAAGDTSGSPQLEEQLSRLQREKNEVQSRLEEDQEDMNELMKKHKAAVAQVRGAPPAPHNASLGAAALGTPLMALVCATGVPGPGADERPPGTAGGGQQGEAGAAGEGEEHRHQSWTPTQRPAAHTVGGLPCTLGVQSSPQGALHWDGGSVAGSSTPGQRGGEPGRLW